MTDSELQTRAAAARARLKQLDPDAHCTYFPMEQKWQVHEWGRPISGFRDTGLEALEEACQILSDER